MRGTDGSRRLDDQARPAGPIPPATLAALIAAIEGKPVARAELIHEADLYHYGRRNPVVLPAVEVVFGVPAAEVTDGDPLHAARTPPAAPIPRI